MRALRQSIAWLILAGLFAVQGSVWVAAHHATLEDDAACAAINGPRFVGPHHQAGLQFERTNLPGPIEHCAICHLQRVAGTARLGRVSAINTAPHLVSAPADRTLTLSLAVLDGSSPRGPPAVLASL